MLTINLFNLFLTKIRLKYCLVPILLEPTAQYLVPHLAATKKMKLWCTRSTPNGLSQQNYTFFTTIASPCFKMAPILYCLSKAL
jgi:hypothetical protein